MPSRLWRWPSHCGGTSLSVVIAVVIHYHGPCFVLVPCPSWLWLIVVNEHLSSSFVRARSGEERAFYLPGLSLCNAKEAIPCIHHPCLVPFASTSFLTQSSPILHQLGYILDWGCVVIRCSLPAVIRVVMMVGTHCYLWVVGTCGHCGDGGGWSQLVEGGGGSDHRVQQKVPYDHSRRTWVQ